MKAVFPTRNLGLMRISRSRFEQSKNCSAHPTNLCFAELCKYWGILGDIWEVRVKFREMRSGEDLMQCRSKGRDRGGRAVAPQFFSQKVETDLYKMLKIKFISREV